MGLLKQNKKQNNLFSLFITFALKDIRVIWCPLSTNDTVQMKKMIVFSPFRLSVTEFWRPS